MYNIQHFKCSVSWLDANAVKEQNAKQETQFEGQALKQTVWYSWGKIFKDLKLKMVVKKLVRRTRLIKQSTFKKQGNDFLNIHICRSTVKMTKNYQKRL